MNGSIPSFWFRRCSRSTSRVLISSRHLFPFPPYAHWTSSSFKTSVKTSASFSSSSSPFPLTAFTSSSSCFSSSSPSSSNSSSSPSSSFASQRRFSVASEMAKSMYDYVRQFELDDRCLQNVWMVVRIDGNNFHEFSKRHNFEKPNDLRALSLMNAAARAVLNEFQTVFIAYGQSDEYSFVFRQDATTCNRRASKLLSLIVSLFTSNYVFQWSKFFPDQELLYPPSFDSRIVLYPTQKNLRDYLAWRQVDCHINNLYNTTFWSLVLKAGMNNQAAMETLKGTLSADKNEILFSQFGINYNNLSQVYRKGTVLYKSKAVSSTDSAETETSSDASSAAPPADSTDRNYDMPMDDSTLPTPPTAPSSKQSKKQKTSSKNKSEKTVVYNVIESNCDIISDAFWESECLLTDFGCSERPFPKRNIAIDRMEDFSKW